MPTIHHTKNYDLFQPSKNRPVCQSHVNAIVSSGSFSDSFKYHPIIVNKDYHIIDGQHRILAAKKLGIHVWYIMQENACEENIKDCNVNQKNWTHQDYIDFYAQRNFEPYKEFLSLFKSHDLPFHLISVICQSFGTSGKRFEYSKQIKSGKLILKNVERIRDFTNLYNELIKKMKKDKGCHSIKYLLNRFYCYALVSLYKNDSQKLETILKKIPEYWKKLAVVGSTEQACEILETIRVSRVSRT